MKIEIYTLGYLANGIPAWGAILVATGTDGKTKKRIESNLLPEGTTKNLADLMAGTKALQCVIPDHRDNDVVFYPPPGYAASMLEKEYDGTWATNPAKNLEQIEALRAMFGKYSKIEVSKAEKTNPTFRELVELLQKKVSDAGLAATQATSQSDSSGEAASSTVS